jgi:hypothetical protein
VAVVARATVAKPKIQRYSAITATAVTAVAKFSVSPRPIFASLQQFF